MPTKKRWQTKANKSEWQQQNTKPPTTGHKTSSKRSQNIQQGDTKHPTRGHKTPNKRTQNIQQEDTKHPTRGHKTPNKRTQNIQQEDITHNTQQQNAKPSTRTHKTPVQQHWAVPAFANCQTHINKRTPKPGKFQPFTAAQEGNVLRYKAIMAVCLVLMWNVCLLTLVGLALCGLTLWCFPTSLSVWHHVSPR